MKTNISPSQFQKKILTWFDSHGRKTLPWQKNKTPYRVWISEVMLQQTQVSTVIPYFERFMQRFPTIELLAQAEEDEVLHYWTGLGYYSRARNLHASAKKIVGDLAGEFPATLIDLEKLPGIGRSTAGAILAIAFQQKATILDGNVKRVLTRFSGITEWPGENSTLEKLWHTAELLTPEKKIADYTQAMMDLGATVCVRGKPQCEKCPLIKHCIAHQLGIEKDLPKSKPKKELPIKQVTLLILQNNHKILLQKRPSAGIWGGLWSLPEITGFAETREILTVCDKQFKCKAQNIFLRQRFRHTFSHYHLDILPVLIETQMKPGKIMDSEQQIWYNLNASQTIGLPAPIKKILEEMNAHYSLSEIR